MEQKQPTHCTISIEVLQAVTVYLQTKPFREVVGILNGLNEAVPVGPTPPPKEETKK